jgi:hypothetical protein
MFHSFRNWKMASTSGVHWKACFSSVSLVSGFEMSSKPEINHLYHVHSPKRLLISCLFLKVGHSSTVFSFSGTVVIPSSDTLWPTYCICFWKTGTFLGWASDAPHRIGTFSVGWAGAPGTWSQSWPHRPDIWGMTHEWGLLRQYPLAVQMLYPVIPPNNGFPFIVSYNSQGYGGGIWTCLHMGISLTDLSCWPSWYSLGTDATENTTSLPTVLLLLQDVTAAVGKCLLHHCLETCLGFQQICQNMLIISQGL